jgi:hypothetical protein
LPLLTVPLGKVRISIWKIVVRRMASEVVENTGESSLAKDRQMLELKTLIQRLP